MLCSPLKSVVFFLALLCALVRDKLKRKGEGDTYSGLALLTSQKWWFLVAKVLAPVRGMERGKLLSLRSRERGALFQGSLCSPLKSDGFWLQKYWHHTLKFLEAF